MKERPILFSAPMVRAILEGRKTITRRVINPQPTAMEHGDFVSDDHRYGKPVFDWKSCESNYHGMVHRCPYGQPGDRLWVRETHYIDGGANHRHVYFKDSTIPASHGLVHWRPSIHMPRWASRILLEVTAVRVERVQDISEEDAKAEGCVSGYGPRREGSPISSMWSARDRFMTLWDSINAKRGYGWDANPWIWVIEFKKVLQ